jgi:hypothetical protein
MRLDIGAVSVGWGLAGDEETDVGEAAVEGLVGRVGWNFEAFVWMQEDEFAGEFEGEFSGEDVEELAGLGVEVTALGGGGRHALFDDGEGWGAEEVVAVALVSPGVVGCGCG